VTAPTRPAPPSRLTRWRLSEPVRFFTWPAVAVFAASEGMQDVAAGEWSLWVLADVFCLACLLLAIAAARLSTYSPTGHLRGVREALEHR
jgi:hypothetical protein